MNFNYLKTVQATNISQFSFDWTVFFLEKWIFIIIIVILISAALFKSFTYEVELCLVLMLAVFLASCIVIPNIVESYEGLAGMLTSTPFESLLKLFILFSSLFILLAWIKNALKGGELMLILFGLLATILMVSVNDLFSLYLLIELQSLCFYVLAARDVSNKISVEAGLKYFILGAVASGIFLYGVSLVYGATGTLNFYELKSIFAFGGLEDSRIQLLFLLGLGLSCVGLLFKLGAAPFHTWLLDVYDGAPLRITFLFITVPKIGILAVMTKFFLVSLGTVYEWKEILLFCGILSIVWGSLGALAQTKIKRWFAYGTVSHVGFLLLALAISNPVGVFALNFYLFIYILLLIPFFLAIIWKPFLTNLTASYNLRDLRNFRSHSLILSILLTFVVFSNGGLPPFIGFFSKLYVMLALINNLAYATVILLIIVSTVSAVYYIRLVQIMFFSQKDNEIQLLKPFTQGQALVLITLILLNIIFVVFPTLPTLFALYLKYALYLSI